MDSEVLEAEIGPLYGVVNRAGNEDLPLLGHGGDASTHVNGDAHGIASRAFHLTHVEAGPDRETDLAQGPADLPGAGDREGGVGEPGDEAIPGGVDLDARPAAE